MKLEQIIYLLEPTLIGNKWLETGELVDCGCRERAKKLQNDGICFVVACAPAFAQFLKDNPDGEWIECEQFLARVKTFPLEWRTPEWEALVSQFDSSIDRFISVNITVNGEDVEPEVVEEKPQPKPKRKRVKKS